MHSTTQKIKFLEKIFGKGRIGGSGNLDVWCPICASKDKKKKKLAIKVSKDFVKCWVCDYKSRNLDYLIRKFGTQENLQEYHREFAVDKARLITIQEEKIEELVLPPKFKLLAETKALTFSNQALFHYLSSRGITRDDMWYYKLGYSIDIKWHRRIIIPSFDITGNLNYFLARSIDKNVGLRYLNPEIERNTVVFNEINIDWSKPVNICEGVFDLMKLPQNSVCLLGSVLTEKYELFHRLVAHETPVTLILDEDKRMTSTIKIADLLMSYGLKVKIAELPDNRDPGAMSKQEVKQILDAAQEHSWQSRFFTKLNKASRVSLSLNEQNERKNQRFERKVTNDFR